MLNILSKVLEKVKDKKAQRAVKMAERLAKKAELLRARANSISSPKSARVVSSAPKSVSKLPVAPVSKPAKVKKALFSFKLPSFAKSKKNLFVNSASKSVKSFYSNLKSVRKMINADKLRLHSSEFSVQPSSGRARTAVSQNQPLINQLESLNFFAITKEVKAQEHLDGRFPGKFLNKGRKANLTKIKAELAILEKEIYQIYKAKQIETAFSDKMKRINEESKVFANAANLVK